MLDLWNKLRRWTDAGRVQSRYGARFVDAVRSIAAEHQGDDEATLVAAAGDAATSGDRERAIMQALGMFDVALQRTFGWSAFDVQIRAAALLAHGRAVEMQTGEGKTLTVAAAAAALALTGRRVHVATVNRYLAERDHRLFAPVLRRLGLAAGLIHDGQAPEAKRAAYAQPIVYGTGYEFGFDYLRDQLAQLRQRSPRLGVRFRNMRAESLQPLLDCAIVDELDSVLLDEACVPLILSEPVVAAVDDLTIFARAEVTADLLNGGEHFLVDTLRRTLTVTGLGYAVIDRSLPRGPSAGLRRPWRQYVEYALTARHLLHRDVEYVVADRRLWLVDLSTGRVFEDRRWPEGLQNAVEFKERVPFSQPTVGAARITRQRFFGLYQSLTGTSGTLLEAADELRQAYRLEMSVVEPRLPSRRVEQATRYFPSDAARLAAVAAETADEHRRGRPVLVGCRTIEAGCNVSRMFESVGLPHRVLNGCQSEDEAQIVAQAGGAGVITVATNLAGRGTDIALDDTARRAGGLHVVGVERHDSPRIDRQLLGRAGRQGDPGSGRFFVSAEDSIVRPFARTAARLAAATFEDAQDDLRREVAQCQTALEAEARLRRRETAASDGRLDDLFAVLAKSE